MSSNYANMIVDGPPFCSGSMHLGTYYNKILKSVLYSYYKTRIDKNTIGFIRSYDAHGLPIELNVLKTLGLRDKTSVVEQGVDNFMNCAGGYVEEGISTLDYEFGEIGLHQDMMRYKPFKTTSRENIAYTIDVIKKLGDSGLIKKEMKVLDYCKKCETVISLSELQPKPTTEVGYYVKFKLQGYQNLFLLVYTTTPSSLLCNSMICYSPTLSYVLVKDTLTERKYVVAETSLKDIFSRLTNLMSTGEYFEFKNKQYYDLHDIVRNFESWGGVTDRGTGLVHIAGCHSQTDFELCNSRSIVINCRMKEFNLNLSNDILEIGSQKITESVVLQLGIVHDKNTCWRCKNTTFKVCSDQVYIDFSHKVKAIQNELSKVYFKPADGLEEVIRNVELRPKWCISRQRFWGTPIPLWTCESCHTSTMLSSEEIQIKLGHSDLRSHNVFDLRLRCHKCGGTSVNCGSVVDVWLQSGTMILNQLTSLGLTMEDVEPTLVESLDQRRGYFLSTAIISYLLTGSVGYSRVLNHGYIMKDKTNKLSKSGGDTLITKLKSMTNKEISSLKEALLSRPVTESIILRDTDFEGEGEIHRLINDLVRLELFYS